MNHTLLHSPNSMKRQNTLIAKKACSFFATLLIIVGSSFVVNDAYGQIIQRGTSTTAISTNTNLTINKPTGVVEGDVMLVNIAKENNGTTNPSLSGWTLIAGAAINGSDIRGAVLYKVAGASEPANYTFALGTNTNDAVGSIVAFSGVDVSGPNPFDVAPGSLSTSTTGASITATGITTTTANAAVILFAQSGDNNTFSSWSTTSPGTLTELYENPFNSSNDDLSVGAAWAIKPSAGATGDGTVTQSASVNA